MAFDYWLDFFLENEDVTVEFSRNDIREVIRAELDGFTGSGGGDGKLSEV